jgi:2-amino-4-hydroxy-6-hydroxymethyldihydropteridine diphosphokinase|tara:strand:- start:62 stop:442 length:381 start_codon:yes stop_codon:yes gene_type:complete
MKYFLSLGSNIEAEKNLDFAEKELNKILTNTKSSSIYRTKAEGFEGDDFLNSIISGDSIESFDELNKKLKSIEDAAGRNRSAAKFSARTLDIDIVLQIDEGEEILFESDEIEKYTFVSDPLKELLK